jgi:hypothetical protein
LITEDVVHRATTVEHPRALEAVLCMGIENDLPGVLRDDPATCEVSGGPVEPPPSPTPGATPKPTPTAAPGGPTPTANPGGPTPTPATTPSGTPTAGATPTPGQSSCTKARVTVRVIFEQADFPDVSGVSVTLDYPEAKLDLPGFGAEPTVLARVSNLTGVSGGLFSVGDQDDEINVGLVSISSPIPSGEFARVEFDCRQGAGAPGSSEVSCTVDGSTLLGNPVDASCTLQLSVN